MKHDHGSFTLNDRKAGALFAQRWFKAALLFFLLAAILGTLMRYYYLREIPFLDYRHILHAHSHVAQMGWAFMLTSGAMLFFITPGIATARPYHYIFWLNVVSVAGMAITFLLQGYALPSIIFSTVHLVTAYLFAYRFLKDIRTTGGQAGNRFIRWSIYWMLVSTLGIWAIPVVSSTLGKMHELYYMSVQFFLHFQFNGWFTYAILGIWQHFLRKRGNVVALPNLAFWLLQLSLVLTYALSVTWSTPVSAIFYLNSLGVILQAAALFLILRTFFRVHNPFKDIAHWTDLLFAFGVLSLITKTVAQLAVAIPAVAEISYTIRNYIVGFIHLIMLGSVTLTLVAILLKQNVLPSDRTSRAGWLLLSSGFLLKEILLFGQGTLLWMKLGFMPYYHEILLGATALLPLALIVIVAGFVNATLNFNNLT